MYAIHSSFLLLTAHGADAKNFCLLIQEESTPIFIFGGIISNLLNRFSSLRRLPSDKASGQQNKVQNRIITKFRGAPPREAVLGSSGPFQNFSCFYQRLFSRVHLAMLWEKLPSLRDETFIS